MSIGGAFDVRRRQLTFEYLDTVTGELKRGRVMPTDRPHLRAWLSRFAGQQDVQFGLEGRTGWRYVVEELLAAGSPRIWPSRPTLRRRSSRRPILTTVRSCRTHAWIPSRQISRAAHACPCPPGRTGRTASPTWPASSSASCPAPPSRTRPAATAARHTGGRSCGPPRGRRPQPGPGQPRPEHLADLYHADVLEHHPPEPQVRRPGSIRAGKRSEPPARHVGWSHHWQPGGPSSWQKIPQGGPMIVAGDTRGGLYSDGCGPLWLWWFRYRTALDALAVTTTSRWRSPTAPGRCDHGARPVRLPACTSSWHCGRR